MYDVLEFDEYKLVTLKEVSSALSLIDLSNIEGTIMLQGDKELLNNSNLKLFIFSGPGYLFELGIHEGAVYMHRNGTTIISNIYNESGLLWIMYRWNINSMDCSISPVERDEATFNLDNYIVKATTNITYPPIGLIKKLRSRNLLPDMVYETPNDLFRTVWDCLNLCQKDINKYGSEKIFWVKKGEPLDEPEISRHLATFLSVHGGSRNFDVTCESIAGTGNLDFCVTAPVKNYGLYKIAIEAKKADSSRIVHGYKVQLPEYMQRIGTQHGIYLIYWLKSPHYPYPKYDTYWDLAADKFKLKDKIDFPYIRMLPLELLWSNSPSTK